MELQEKEKNAKHIGKLIRKPQRQKIPINSICKAIYIPGQKKAFYRGRIPQSSCERNKNCWHRHRYNTQEQ